MMKRAASRKLLEDVLYRVRQLEIERPSEKSEIDKGEKKEPVGSAGAVRNDRWTRHG